MATLEKIRSKSVLLVVIIAVALLAFILGDAITNGRNLFGNNTTVAKVGKDKIEIQDYQRKQQEISQQIEETRRQNPQAASNYDSQLIGQQAIEQLIDQKLLNNAAEALGIQVTPELLRYFMIENPNTMIPEMQQLIRGLQQSGLQVQSAAEAYAVIFQPQGYGLSQRQVAPFQQQWVALEGRYTELIGQMIYMNLLGNTYKANKLDIAAVKRDMATAKNVTVAKKPYDEAELKKISVSDDEIKKAYESQKELYKIGETTKAIAFISVNVPPSNSDVEKASLLATTVMTELRTKNDVSKETRKNGLDVQNHEMRLSDVKNPALKAFLQSASIGSDSIIFKNQSGFQIARVKDRSSRIDSVEVSSIAVQGDKELVDKVLAYANSNAALDSISNFFEKDKVQYMAPQWIALYNADGTSNKNLGMQEATYDSLVNKNGAYMVIDQQEGVAVLAAIKDKKTPKEVVSYLTIDYVLQPSENTLADARQKLEKFVSQNNTASKFVANAKKAGYNPVDLAITPSTPAIPMGPTQFYPDSRSLVRWVVMDGKDGEVSKIYQSKDNVHPSLYVAAVIDTYEEYVPWNNKQVKEELTAQIRRDKAGDLMVKKYAKPTVEQAAQAMQVEPVNVEKLTGAKRDMTVTDNKVKGRIMGSNKTNKAQAVKGNDGVYVFTITEVTEETNLPDDDQLGQMFLQMHRTDPSAALRGNKKIENNVYKFEQGE